jgi:hypothetical protein
MANVKVRNRRPVLPGYFSHRYAACQEALPVAEQKLNRIKILREAIRGAKERN